MYEYWDNPFEVKFIDGDFIVNDQDLGGWIEKAVKAWKNKDYETVGQDIAEASLILIEYKPSPKKPEPSKPSNPSKPNNTHGGSGGLFHIEEGDTYNGDDDDDTDTQDIPQATPENLYYKINGSEFISGFLFGSGIGDFDEK